MRSFKSVVIACMLLIEDFLPTDIIQLKPFLYVTSLSPSHALDYDSGPKRNLVYPNESILLPMLGIQLTEIEGCLDIILKTTRTLKR